MSDLRPRRSVLYMPGSNARALAKARTLAADSLILDLEDAVSPDEKADARAQVCRAVRDGGYGDRELVIRVNGLDTPWGEADLAASAQARPHAILVPKVSSAAMLAAVADRLDAASAAPDVAVWAMIETPAAIVNLADIARARRERRTRLTCLVLGLNDLSKDTRTLLVPGRASMLPWMMAALAAARAEGLAILDGVWNDIGDRDGCRAECAEACRLGFDGKTLIHPDQIEAANAAFTPDPADVDRARAVIAAFDTAENAGRAVIKLDGRLYERQHLAMATRVVGWAEAIAARED